MEVANTPAYKDTETITAVKCFIVQGPGERKYNTKTFYKIINDMVNIKLLNIIKLFLVVT